MLPTLRRHHVAFGPVLFWRGFQLGVHGWWLALCLVGAGIAGAEESMQLEDKLDELPQPISQTSPIYPFALRLAGLNGLVSLEFIVTSEGRVVHAFVTGSNNPGFERAALDAVERWTFTPGRKNGRAVNTRCSIEVPFTLIGGGEEPWRVPKIKDPAKVPASIRWEIAPVPVNTVFPVYPFEDSVKETKGRVRIAFVVGADGQVLSSKITQSGTPEMNHAVAAALDAWRFVPARNAAGEACGALLNLEYEFHPRGRGDVPLSDSALDILHRVRKGKPFATLKELDEPLQPRGRRTPVYPSAQREKGEDGQAEIEFFIDEKGDAQLPRVVSATAPEFGYAAAQAVATWRFSVPLKNNRPVIVRTSISVNFTLHDSAVRAPDQHSL